MSSSTSNLFKKKKSRPAASLTATADPSSSVAGPSRLPHPDSDKAASAEATGQSRDRSSSPPAASSVVRLRKGAPLVGRNAALAASSGIAKRLRAADSDGGDTDEEEDATGKTEWTDRFGETIHETGTQGLAATGKRKRGVDGLFEGLSEESQRITATGDAVGEGSKTIAADGTYAGKSSYLSYLPTRDSGQSSKLSAAAAKGPIQASKHIRTVTLVDYQPDICKSYKETGYCGFGDTCKFLHDRSDYLAGWQLDGLANSDARRAEVDDDEAGGAAGFDEEEEEIPFACLICRKPFTDPVVTKCNHYFCSACAIKRFAKTGKCFACGAQTGGLFNSATKVLKRMEAKKDLKDLEREQKRNRWGNPIGPNGETAEEAGGEDDDGNQIDFGIQGVEVAT